MVAAEVLAARARHDLRVDDGAGRPVTENSQLQLQGPGPIIQKERGPADKVRTLTRTCSALLCLMVAL